MVIGFSRKQGDPQRHGITPSGLRKLPFEGHPVCWSPKSIDHPGNPEAYVEIVFQLLEIQVHLDVELYTGRGHIV